MQYQSYENKHLRLVELENKKAQQQELQNNYHRISLLTRRLLINFHAEEIIAENTYGFFVEYEEKTNRD
ncbi:hypothetical protein T01_13411 [Trichinella spiralis]|uniref:Uncharacterized protein n=1 Tax=Trichinella spiralis TaxID=6334 RepID=A0A0V1B6R7_TRISP|nr:hypothetical protein T01_13411 [Trichinella spiralis]